MGVIIMNELSQRFNFLLSRISKFRYEGGMFNNTNRETPLMNIKRVDNKHVDK